MEERSLTQSHLREILNKPADVHQILSWILSNIKVSELETMSITIVGPKDYIIRILGSKIEEINNRARFKNERETRDCTVV